MAVSAYAVSGGSYFLSVFLVLALALTLLSEAGSSHRRASNFLVRDKKVTKEARLPTASGGTHCALAALRSNSRRKFEGIPRSWGARRLRARDGLQKKLLCQYKFCFFTCMKKPSVFIASSTEGLQVADAINVNLDHDFYCTLWRNGTFRLGSDGLTDLIEKTSAVDFAVFVFTPDDVVLMRDQERLIARDNVVFELGLFIGAIGKDRCYVVKPRGLEMHLPSDVAGVVTADYVSDRPDKDIASALNFACKQIKDRVAELGALLRIENTKDNKRVKVNSPDYEISNVDLALLANCINSQVSNPVGLPFDVVSRGLDAHEHQISLAAVKLSRLGYIEKTIESNNYDGCEYFSYRATEDGLDLFLKNERVYAEMNKKEKYQKGVVSIRKPASSGGFDDMDDDLPF